MIIDQLITRIIEMKNPTVVGLDPRPEYIPSFIREEACRLHEEPCRAMAYAILVFNKALIDALYDIVPAVKPQIAFYEQYGTAGIECYRETVRYAKQKELIVIGDIKRGDIASTAQAYADAHIGKVETGGQAVAMFDTDFVTINPYLGYDAVSPFLDNCRLYDRGLFVLVRTSNPGAGDIQDLETPGGKVYEVVGDKVSAWGADLRGQYGYSTIGAVVGATHPSQARVLRERMPHTFFLVPGYGAQGGTAEGVHACLHQDGMGAIVNNSRGIIAAHLSDAYKDRYPKTAFAGAARESALAMRAALAL